MKDIDLFLKVELQYLKDRFAAGQPYFGHLINSAISPPQYIGFLKACALHLARERGSLNNVLEVGCYAGLSTLGMIEAIRESGGFDGVVTVVDPGCHHNTLYPNECLDASGRDLSTYGQLDLFEYNLFSMGWRHHVRLIKDFSGRALPWFADSSFDLIAIDGDHSYEAVLNDLRGARRLVRDGGLICGDDHDLSGVARAFGEVFSGAAKPVSSFWAVKRDGNGWRTMPAPRSSLSELHFFGDCQDRFLDSLSKYRSILIPPRPWRQIRDRAVSILSQHQRVALYGAGKFAEFLQVVLDDELIGRIVWVMDDCAKPAREVLGRTPVPPGEVLGKTEPDAIILGSDAFESELLARARSWKLRIPIYSLCPQSQAMSADKE